MIIDCLYKQYYPFQTIFYVFISSRRLLIIISALFPHLFTTVLTEYIYNIYVHCLKIYSFGRASEAGMFRSECKLILYLPTICVYCVYLVLLKRPKQEPNCLKRVERSVVIIGFNCFHLYYRFFLSLYTMYQKWF